MRKIVVLLALACVQCGPVPVVAQTNQPIDVEAVCEQQRGCIRVTRQWIEETVMFYVVQALMLAEAENAAKPVPVCKKDST